jgi:DNA polymerase-1
VSIWVPGKVNRYYGWGHPGRNPHTFEQGRRALARVWDKPLVFHNCKFDIGVAIEHMGLPWPQRYDDTMFQTYLVDPLAKSLKLKGLAQKWLGMDPEERDAVYLWLKQNFKGPFLADHKMITEANAGAYIGYAPYDIVAPYACGDTFRTKGLHSLLRPKVTAMGMDAAYQRELIIAQHGYWMERVGVRVNREALIRDLEKYEAIKAQQTDIITSYLGDIDVGKPAQLARALLEKGYADDLPLTPTGKMSTAKASIEENVNEPTLARAIRYRGALKTLTQTFFKGWIKFSEVDGNVHPSWNQVKSEKGGARTGRFSCSEPNLTNVATEFDEDTLEGLDLPFMRQYLLPDEGQIIVPADFNGQEMRILAHYAEGRLAQVYQEDPTADFHAVASALIKQYAGLKVPRRMCKIVGFSLIYGSGVATLAKQLGVTHEVAYRIKNAYFKAFPGLREFINLFRQRDAITTWGGRRLPCESAGMVDGEWHSYNYKLVNYLIQGSAADQSKEAIVRYGDTRDFGRLMMMVHDELVMSVPLDYIRTEVPILKSAMEEMPGWDVPFRVEVEQGLNWYNLKEYA